MSVTAKFPGTCARSCGRPIRRGDQIAFIDRELFHEACAGEADTPAPLTRSVCPNCFTEVAISGGCMC